MAVELVKDLANKLGLSVNLNKTENVGVEEEVGDLNTGSRRRIH
jgi:hypothetical protein